LSTVMHTDSTKKLREIGGRGSIQLSNLLEFRRTFTTNLPNLTGSAGIALRR
jgi:hypothetical protein